jgi:glutamate racemase
MDQDPPAEPAVTLFDSGVGGLSIAAAIRARLPGVRLDYSCDDGYFPYGEKPEAALIRRVGDVAAAAVERTNPQVFVVACNTASTVALPHLRERLAMPVVGVVPAVKPAARLSKRRIIGVLGTTGTTRRHYLQALIDEFAADCTVLKIGAPDLVELAEAQAIGEAVPDAEIARILAPFFDRPTAEQPDVLVLACTHFPLLRPALERVCPQGVMLVDSGSAIAERVAMLLPQSSPAATGRPGLVHYTGAGASLAAFARAGFASGDRIALP